MWFLFSFFGVGGIQPVGFMDYFGYVFPPKWLFLVSLFISLIEWVTITTFFPLQHK